MKRGNVETYKSKKDEQEFPKGHHGLMICKQCGIYYYRKAWHHSFDIAKHLDKNDRPVLFVFCPACTMIKRGQHEGIITIPAVPRKYLDDLTNLIHHSGEFGWERDPLDRVIAIVRTGGGITVTTTENQLAQQIAKKIEKTFPVDKVTIARGKEPSDVVDITITFAPETGPKEHHYLHHE